MHADAAHQDLLALGTVPCVPSTARKLAMSVLLTFGDMTSLKLFGPWLQQ